jgi:hypothetical protein
MYYNLYIFQAFGNAKHHITKIEAGLESSSRSITRRMAWFMVSM